MVEEHEPDLGRPGQSAEVVPGTDASITVGGGCHSHPDARVSLRRLPRLVREGVGLVWAAGRREFVLVLGLQLVSGVVVTVLLSSVARVWTASSPPSSGEVRWRPSHRRPCCSPPWGP